MQNLETNSEKVNISESVSAMNVGFTITKRKLAWIQIPLRCDVTMEYFNNEVFNVWSDYLHVYSAGVRKKSEIDPKVNAYVLSAFIAQKCKLRGNYDSSVEPYDDVNIEFAALHHAMQWVVESFLKESSQFIFFTKSVEALEQISLALDQDIVEGKLKEVIDDLLLLKKTGKNIVLAWVPSDATSYKCVSKYAKHWTHTSEISDSVTERKEATTNNPLLYDIRHETKDYEKIYYSQKVFSLFHLHNLMVYTNAKNKFWSTLQIPQWNMRLCTYTGIPCNIVIAEEAAVYISVEVLNSLKLQNRNIIIISTSDKSLDQLNKMMKYDLRHKVLMHNLDALHRKGNLLAFLWFPENTPISSIQSLKNENGCWTSFSKPKLEQSKFEIEKEKDPSFSNKETLRSININKHSTRISITSNYNLSKPFQFFHLVYPPTEEGLFVYTNVIYNKKENGGLYVTSVYIPELKRWDQKRNWLTLCNKQTAQFAALQFAVQIVKNLRLSNTKVIIFTESKSAMKNLAYALHNETEDRYHRLIIDNICSLVSHNVDLTFNFYPSLSGMFLYTSVAEYAERGFLQNNKKKYEDDSNFISEYCIVNSDNIWISSYEYDQRLDEIFNISASTCLKVYTAAIEDNLGDEHESTTRFVTSYYIPQMQIWERKLQHSSKKILHGNEQILVALHFALERVSLLDFKEENLMIFSTSEYALKQIIKGFDHCHVPKSCKHLIEGMNILKTKEKRIVIAKLLDTDIPEYRSVLEFAQAWNYDDHYNTFKKSPNRDEDGVYTWSPTCFEFSIIRHEIAWIQRPQKSPITNREEYFINQILPCWCNYLQVYVTAVPNKVIYGWFVISVYCPELNLLERNSKYLSEYDDSSAHLAALNWALHRVAEFHKVKSNIVFFTKSEAALSYILHAMNHGNISECWKELKVKVKFLKKRLQSVAFAWMPPDLAIPQYRIVTDYATALSNNDELERDTENNDDEDGNYNYDDNCDFDLLHFKGKQRLKHVTDSLV